MAPLPATHLSLLVATPRCTPEGCLCRGGPTHQTCPAGLGRPVWEAPDLTPSLPAGHTQAWPHCTQGLWRPLVEEESESGENSAPTRVT